MLGGPPAVIEVYPYGSFAALLVGRPPSSRSAAGQRFRIVTLRRAGLEWDEYFDHARLDALGGGPDRVALSAGARRRSAILARV